MPVLDVLDETLRGNVVVVDSDTVKLCTIISSLSLTQRDNTYMASTVAGLHEVSNPNFAVRIGARGGGDESIALVLERLNVLLPQGGAVLGFHVGLTRLIRPRGDLISRYSQ